MGLMCKDPALQDGNEEELTPEELEALKIANSFLAQFGADAPTENKG